MVKKNHSLQLPSNLNNRGDDLTTLLFLHGFTSNKESWVRVTQNLPSTWRILVLDMPGHGESSFDPSSDYSTFGMAEKVHMVSKMHMYNVMYMFLMLYKGILYSGTSK